MVKKFEHIILAGGQIYSDKNILKNSAIVIHDKKIQAIIDKNAIKKYEDAKVFDFPDDFSIIPGFIDMHIHGSNGHDVMDASFDSLKTISESLKKQGTTSFLATTMTATPDQIENVLGHVREFTKHQHDIDGAKVLGVHLEGPFLSPNKVGAQRKDLILNPDIQLLKKWQAVSNNIIKLVTIAPELEGSLDFIRFLKENNIVASMGHTDATYKEAEEAIFAGCAHATHLFNAMRSMHQREPGAVTAALLSDALNAELIVDGVHLHPAIVELIYKLKKEKIILVTDAMRAQCLQDGKYDLGGQDVIVKNHVAKLADGTLAGSTLQLPAAIKNIMNYTSCGMFDIIRMTSETPAKSLNIFPQKGSLSVGNDADIVVMDKQLGIIMTLC